jgi:hypothetical protein
MMGIDTLREFLGWCSIINFSILMWWFAFIALAHDWVYRLHTRWFSLSVERFDAIHYAGMAFYKLLWLVFNIVPYLALLIIDKAH